MTSRSSTSRFSIVRLDPDKNETIEADFIVVKDDVTEIRHRYIPILVLSNKDYLEIRKLED